MSPAPNAFEPRFDEVEPHRSRARLGRQAGAKCLGISLYQLETGGRAWPYHLHHANEELLVVLAGAPTLRTPGGERELRAGATVALPRGSRGAHQLTNRSDAPVRYLLVSEMNAPEAVVYPDSGKVGVLSRAPGSIGDEDELAAWFRLEDQVDYWDGEDPPPEEA